MLQSGSQSESTDDERGPVPIWDLLMGQSDRLTDDDDDDDDDDKHFGSQKDMKYQECTWFVRSQ